MLFSRKVKVEPSRPSLVATLLLLGACLFVPNGLEAQYPGFRFDHIARAREIGQVNQHGVVKDVAGFVWIGANDRLLRFDGTDLRTFRFAPEDVDEHRTAWTSAVEIDSSGNIWMGTRRGLARLAPQRERIQFEETFNSQFPLTNTRAVMSIAPGAGTTIWCAVAGSVWNYNYETGKLKEEIPYDRERGRPLRIYREENDTVWVIFKGGHVASRRARDAEFRFDSLRDYPGATGKNFTTTAAQIGSQDEVYMATWSGLFLMNLKTRRAKEIKSSSPHLELNGLSRVRSLCLDDEHPGKIWVGTKMQGLALLDIESGESIVFVDDRNNPSDLLSNNIYSVQKDRDGLLWIGCSAGYSLMYTSAAFSFTTLQELGREPIRVGRPGVAFDQDGRAWLGFPDCAFCVREKNGKQTYLELPAGAQKLKKSIRQCMVPGDSNEMWLSIFELGVLRIGEDRKVTLFAEATETGGLRSNKIEALYWAAQDQLVVGSNLGLEVFNPSTGKSREIEFARPDRSFKTPKSRTVRLITPFQHGTLYASTLDDRLLRFDPNSKRAEVFDFSGKRPKKGPQNITGIGFDGDDGLWISAFNGIFHWEDSTRTLRRIETLDRFSRVGRNGMLVDDQGSVWFAGMANTLVRYAPTSEEFRFFDLEDAMGTIRFMPGQHAKSPDGQLHFLCRQGLLSFQPSRLRQNSVPRKPVITGLDVLGKELWEGRESVGANVVEIDESDNFVTLRFVSPNSSPNDLLSYSYRLSGIRPEWVDIEKRKAIDFSNLPPGSFDFEVRATYNATGMSSVSSPITLVVKPPLLARPRVRAAIALGSLLLMGLFAFARYRAVKRHARTLQVEIDGRSRAEAALAESEARLATAFNSMPCATWVRERNGTVTMANPLFTQTWGDLVGKKEPASSMPEIYAESWQSDHERALSGETVQETLDYNTENEVCRVIHVVSPIFVDDEVTGTVGVDVDVSVLRRSELDKMELEQQLRHAQKLEAIGKLAGGVAHDFNNILTAISGHAELIKRGLEDGDGIEALSSDLDGVVNSSGRAARLTQQLLTFTKKGLVVPEVFDPAPVLEDMRAMMERLIKPDIDFNMDFEKGCGSIHADRAQFEQIVLNLIVNASDAMPEGGRIDVSLRACHIAGTDGNPAREAVGMNVKDTGIGMTREVRDRVFEPYFTTKPVGEGTGLGLSTVHGIVEGMGGTISLASEPGAGTSIDVVIPCHEATEAPEAEPVFDLNTTDEPAQQETVVVCEDNESVRKVTCGILELNGFHVITAGSPEEAIEAFADAEVTPPLLITDVVMPGMDGPQLADKLLATHPGLKVLFMSGYTSDALEATELQRENVGFLNKPFSANTLLAETRALLKANEVNSSYLDQELREEA